MFPGHVGERRDDDDRKSGIDGTEQRKNRQAIRIRQHDVQQHGIDFLGPGYRNGIGPSVRDLDMKAGVRKQIVHRERNVDIVVDDQEGGPLRRRRRSGHAVTCSSTQEPSAGCARYAAGSNTVPFRRIN